MYQYLVLWALLTVPFAQGQFQDVSPLPYVFQSNELPTDGSVLLPRYMPYVGNGHVATTPRTKWVFMNGLYNGERGESHRARIPAVLNVHIEGERTNATYELNVAEGYYTEKFTQQGYRVESRMYAHRLYQRVLVTEFRFSPISAAAPAEFLLGQPLDDGKNVTDLVFGPPTEFNNTGVLGVRQCGETLQSEDVRFQPLPTPVCMVYTKLPTNNRLTVTGNQTIVFWASYDNSLQKAEEEYLKVLELSGFGTVFENHRDVWRDIWNSGSVTVEGDTKIGKLIYGCFYYILSSIPYTGGAVPYDGQFYGLSPGGLAYGDYLMDYQGHSFWDTETWMYPPILYFFPDMAKSILNYRLYAVPTARDRANETGYKGSRFPWESGFTGREVTPDCCPETRDLQIHNTGDIAFAIRQYVSATRDLDWLKLNQSNYVTSGCGLVREIAEFWVSRAKLDDATNQYDIDDVMCPDEDHFGVNNSIYTNIVAGYSIFFAKYAECLGCPGIPDNWLDVARSLGFNYDASRDFHPEFDGYTPEMIDASIKQADVVLLGFPLMYPMNASTRRNDLEIYEPLTRPNGPAMTWAMHTIGFLELGDLEKVEPLFNKSYQPYMREPFKVWTEAQAPEFGAVNFITGMGGFLQGVVSGFGGLRLHPEKLEFFHPRVIPGTTALNMLGLKYLGNTLDVTVNGTTDAATFVLRDRGPSHSLVLTYTSGGEPVSWPLGEGVPITVPNASSTRIVVNSLPTFCPLPEDIIGKPVNRQRPH